MTNTNTKIPKFLRCLYDILHFEDQTILAWSHDGTCFQVRNVSRLENEVLPKYFKHGKFTSFQRQLNNHGFHKWTKTRANVCTFSHDALVHCHPSHLSVMIAATYTASSKTSLSASMTTKVEYTASSSQLSGLKRQREESQLIFNLETADHKKKAKQLCIETVDVDQLFDDLLSGSPLVLLDAVDVSDLLALDWGHAAAVGGGDGINISEDAVLQLEPLSFSLSFDFDFEYDNDDLAAFDLDAFVEFGDDDAIVCTSEEILLDDVLVDADVSLLELEDLVDF